MRRIRRNETKADDVKTDEKGEGRCVWRERSVMPEGKERREEGKGSKWLGGG